MTLNRINKSMIDQTFVQTVDDHTAQLAETTQKVDSQFVNVMAFIDKSQHEFILSGDVASQDASLVTTGIKNAITEANNTTGKLEFMTGDYRINNYLVFEKIKVKGNHSIIWKDFNGVAMFCVGGAVYTEIYDLFEFGYGAGIATGSDSGTNEHGIAVFNNRVKLINVRASSNRGHGVLIGCYSSTADYTTPYPFLPTYTGNMNKCMFDIEVTGNDKRGIHFEGDKDDSSVWDIKIISRANYLSGIYTAPEYMGRQWRGWMYSETDALSTVDHSIHFEKLRASELWIYSEGQSNTAYDEIRLGTNTSQLKVFSGRNNRDSDLGANNVFHVGNGEAIRNVGRSDINPPSTLAPYHQPNLVQLTNKTYNYADDVKSNSNTVKVNRSFGSGAFRELIFDKTSKEGRQITNDTNTDSTTINQESANGLLNTVIKGRGNIDAPSDILNGDIIETQEFRGIVGGFSRPALKINVVADGLATGKMGARIDIYMKDENTSSYPAEPTIKINKLGRLTLNQMKGTNNSILKTNTNGFIHRGADDIATQIDGAVDLAALKTVLKSILA